MKYINQIIQGDTLTVLRTFHDQCVQTCITSPPYWGLRDYGVDGQLGLEPTPEEYVAKMVGIFQEVRRVLRDDGTLWLNLGDSYASGGQGGNQTKFKHNHCQHIKPYKISPGLKPKDLCGIPWRVAFALRADGWYLRSDIIWSKPSPMPESVTDRPTKAHEYIFLMSKSSKYYYDNEAIKENCTTDENRPAGVVRDHEYGYDSKRNLNPEAYKPNYKTPDGWDTSKGEGGHGSFHKKGREKGNRKSFRGGGKYTERGAFDNSTPAENKTHGNTPNISMKRNKRTVWSVATQPFKAAHFATFPEKLVEPCVLAGAPEGGVVLDPFSGAATVAVVAKRANRKYVGIELNPEYIKVGDERLKQEVLAL